MTLGIHIYEAYGFSCWMIDLDFVALRSPLGQPGAPVQVGASYCEHAVGPNSTSTPCSSPSSSSSHWSPYPLPRLRPTIPPLLLHRLPLVQPVATAGHPDSDVPHQMLLQQAFRSVLRLGPSPRLPVLQEASSPGGSSCAATGSRGSYRACATCHYTGPWSLASWNTQALFAVDPEKHKKRTQQVHRLMASHDVGCWSETHGAMRSDTWRNPPGCRSWWSPGPSAAAAGVGITVQEAFLKRFSQVRPEVIFPGRAIVLRLNGDQGAVDIFSVYFPTGDSAHTDDMKEAGYDPAIRTVSNFELREALRHRLAQRMRPRDQVMTLLAGDFNFVTSATDRFCASSASATGGRDFRDHSRWRDIVEVPYGLHELHQPAHTYASPDSRSRLDRVYSNQWDTEFLDRQFTSTALHWVPNLSRHRPLSVRKFLPDTTDHAVKPIPDQILDHPDWPRQVSLAWHELLRAHPSATSIEQLKLVKEAMRQAERALGGRIGEASQAEDLEDRIGIAMRFLRAAEAGVPERVTRCLDRYPVLRELVVNPYDFSTPAGPRLVRVRRHVMDLQRDFTMQELTALHEDLRDLDPLQASRRRQRNQRLVSRLAPGRSCQAFAVDDPTGTATTDPQAMLSLIRSHWESVFRRRDIDEELLGHWMHEDARHLPEDYATHLPHDPVPLSTFRKAILCTKNSAPGRDGIPFKAWRRIVDLAAGIFAAAFREMVAPDGLQQMRDHWGDFNEALMVFLPKKAKGTLPDGTEIFSPSSLRPLSLTNTDNRILSSAVRLHIEPIVAPGISPEQRGFIRGRSMLANVLDVEEGMLNAAMSEDNPVAVFLDFEAAFPSLSQDFIRQVLAARGWPLWMQRFVAILYTNNFCVLSACGATGPGFGVTAGVRQGCPLSPLLFSIVSDVLLRRVRRLSPGSLVRAYADDIAVVLRRLLEARQLEDIFAEYSLVSGLRLHSAKSIIVPLSIRSPDDIRTMISSAAPTWGSLTIKDNAKYLGYVLGPGRGEQAWTGVLRKMHERARIWRGVGAGMMVSLQAIRVYVFPLAGFLLQLQPLPSSWDREEAKIINTMFPGARGWASSVLMRHLRSLGFAAELPCAASASLGARCRVHRWEDADNGGLRIRHRFYLLTMATASSPYLDRAGLWRSWLDGNFFAHLQDARRQLAEKAEASGVSIATLLQGASPVPVPRGRWQKQAGLLLRPPEPLALDRHLRRRLDRWDVPVLQGHRVPRLQRVLRRLGPLVPPCVWASALKALMDGWTSADPSRRAPHCCFGCVSSQDTIQHYARCPVVARLAQARLRLDPVAFTGRLEDFLLLRSGTDEHISLGALRLYATFMATNAVRHGRSRSAEDAWLQAMTDAAGRASPLGRVVANLWNA